MLHFNELPLRHVYCAIDGTTTGPNSFSGSIGKRLIDCEKLPVKLFKPIYTDEMMVFDKNTLNSLSVDQRYIYDIVHGIQEGKIDASLAAKAPGKLCHSRWLTLASRILRLYVSYEKAPKNVETLAEFVVKIYAPMWFLIKKNHNVSSGPSHVFKFIELSRYLPSKFKNIVDNAIQRNAFFAHRENVLLAMLIDDQETVRKRAVELIVRARQFKSSSVRKLIMPIINFDAKVYYEMIDLEKDGFIEPPITKKMSIDDLKNENSIKCLLHGIPCHSQGTERTIRLVSESCKIVSDEDRRNEVVRCTIASRKILNRTESKQDYAEYMKMN